MIDVGAHDGGGELGTQAQAPVPMGKGIHARRDLFTRLAQEQIKVFEDGCADRAITVLLEVLEKLRLEAIESSGAVRQQIERAAHALNLRYLHPSGGHPLSRKTLLDSNMARLTAREHRRGP